MAVRDVFNPKPVNPLDPKKPEEGQTEWDRKAKEAKARLEYMESQKMIDRLAQPDQPPQPPAFQVQGGVHLDIDPQRDAQQAREELKAQQEKNETEQKRLAGELEKTKDELRGTRMSAAMKELGDRFSSELKEMSIKIEAVKQGGDPSSLVAQFEILTQVAEKMGYQKGTPQIGDPQIQLEITKLQMENARAEREFKARLAQESRQWDLEKIKLADDRAFRQAQLAQEAKKSEMFANAPKYVGEMLAKGFMASQGETGVAEEQRQQQKGKVRKHIEAGWEEAGEIECPSCSQPVAIGPTARVAVCANCGNKYPIKRIGERTATAEEE